MKNPTNTPTKATTTKINMTLIGDMFFLDSKYQQPTTKEAVNKPGYTESNLSCSVKMLFPSDPINANDVLTLTQVAATAPMTIPPNKVIDSRNANPCGPTKKSTALPPSS